MAYQITLSPEQYEAISAAATQAGKSVEELALETLAERFPPSTPLQLRRKLSPLVEYMYRIGHVSNLPTGEPDTPEEEAERERLINSIKPGKPLSEMVIEDRGPR
jgi:hypothetical protein